MRMNEQLQAKATQEARAILTSFGTTLAKVKLPKQKQAKITEHSGTRTEGAGKQADSAFRKQFFANASKHDDEYLLAEKKEW